MEIHARPVGMSEKGVNQQIEITLIANMDKVADLPLVSMYKMYEGFPSKLNFPLPELNTRKHQQFSWNWTFCKYSIYLYIYK